jgi:hypothetical protein
VARGDGGVRQELAEGIAARVVRDSGSQRATLRPRPPDPLNSSGDCCYCNFVTG